MYSIQPYIALNHKTNSNKQYFSSVHWFMFGTQFRC